VTLVEHNEANIFFGWVPLESQSSFDSALSPLTYFFPSNFLAIHSSSLGNFNILFNMFCFLSALIFLACLIIRYSIILINTSLAYKVDAWPIGSFWTKVSVLKVPCMLSWLCIYVVIMYSLRPKLLDTFDNNKKTKEFVRTLQKYPIRT
jgi:hypothetical protein